MNDSTRPTTVVLLHGWPGLPSDFDAVRDALGDVRVIVPDLAGFGAGYTGNLSVEDATAEAHARRVLAQLDALDATGDVRLGGYDVGSRIAQAALRLDPHRFAGAVLTPAYPGIGDRASAPDLAPEFWYQHFHRTPLAAQLIDGNVDAVRTYLGYLWQTWSGPDAAEARPGFERVVEAYSRHGAFAASLQWYQANRGYAAEASAITTPVTMLWPEQDPLFPVVWADRLDESFANATLRTLPNVGHFVPVEAPDAFARAVLETPVRLRDLRPR